MAGQIYAVVSLLGDEARAEATAIWDQLQEKYGAHAAREAIDPHVTYLVGETPAAEQFAACIAEEIAVTEPFSIQLDGYGMFPGPPPVLFLRIVRSAALSTLFERVTTAAERAGIRIWPNYTSQTWVPHCTLALRDLPLAALPTALDDLARRRLRVRTMVLELRLAVVRQPLSESAYITTFPLAGRPA